MIFSACCTLLCCALIGSVHADTIIANVGTDVTLPCSYDAKGSGRLPVCWGRGPIPSRGCANVVITSDGTTVTSRLSERYLLMGNLAGGDVSLTIRQVEESDTGTYGCRVEIPGWFNDQKHEMTLTVMAVRPNPLKVEIREVRERTITVRWTAAFDGGRSVTAYTIDIKTKEASWDRAARTEIYNTELTTLTLVDLRPATTYSLRMFATNNVGMSESSNVPTVTTREAAPEGPPQDMQLLALSSSTVRVAWKLPRADLRNGVIRSYNIHYREYHTTGRQHGRWQQLSVAAAGDGGSAVLSNLKPSTKYSVLVQARTNIGVGPAATALCSTLDEVHTTSTAPTGKSATSSVVSTDEPVATVTVWGELTTPILAVAPDPPVVQLKEVKDNTISLSWTSGFEGDGPITGYYLEYKAANASWDNTKTVVDFGPNQTEATIIEINRSTYNIRMFARNFLATSKASNILNITTGEAGHPRDDHETTTDSRTAASVENSQGSHLAAIVVPVVLLVLGVALLATWQLRRMKQRKGSLSMWLTGGALRFRGSEPLQEL